MSPKPVYNGFCWRFVLYTAVSSAVKPQRRERTSACAGDLLDEKHVLTLGVAQ
jgi:hypothetical protein